MAGPAATALAVFEDHLVQIEIAVSYLAAASSAKKHAYQVINWTSQLPYEIKEVKTFLDAKPYPEQLHCNSNYLSSVAAFEQFLREALESAIRARVNSASSFDQLGDIVQDMHMKATGRLLTMKEKPPQQLGRLDFFEVCRRIGTCLPGSTTFEFNSEALCLQGDLLELESFFDTLNKFGYTIGFDKLGADAGLRTCFGASNTRKTRKALEAYVEDMTRQRNRIAHTGTSASQVTPAVLAEHLVVLRSLAQAVAGAM